MLATSRARLDEDIHDGSFGIRENGLSISSHGTLLDRGSGYPVCSSTVFRSDWMGHSTHVIPRGKTHRDLLSIPISHLLILNQHVFQDFASVFDASSGKRNLNGRSVGVTETPDIMTATTKTVYVL